MKVCIVGPGAIGGLLGTCISQLDQVQVSAFARGETLAALKEHGWRLHINDKLISGAVNASDNALDLGEQDLVIITVKAPALISIISEIKPLIGTNTIVLPAINGVPWWFLDTCKNISHKELESVNPKGRISNTIPFSNLLGVVVHASALRKEPGKVEHKMGKSLIIGEPVGGESERVNLVAKLLINAGFEVTISNNVRKDIWYKLWGNMTINPLSAITGATADLILSDKLVREFCSNIMREASIIGSIIGCPILEEPESRHNVTAKLGAFKTSMLQDVESSRQLELDAIVGAVCEIAERIGVSTPNLNALFGVTRLFGRVKNIYPS
jgi:2-dehydropantoate 2-reductase